MIHLTLNQISAYIDSELPEVSVELVRLHLSSCLECTERFGLIEEQEDALARLLVYEPGDPFFADFAEGIVGKAPRTAAADRTVEERRAPPRRAPPRRRPARVLVPAAALLSIATAAAVVLATRPDLARFGRGRPPADATGSGTSFRANPAHAPRPISPTAALLERAAARSAEAQRVRTAESYDIAADAWQAAIPALQNDPEELAAGHREIAAARFAAWNAAPNTARHDAAMTAVRAYLLCAPPGVDRDRAWSWLARLKQ